MPRGKQKTHAHHSNLVEAAEYRAAWWGPARDEPGDETYERVRHYVVHDPDPDRLARFTAAEVAAECNLAVKVAHFDLERLRDAGVVLRYREPIMGLGGAYVWERAHGQGGVRVLGAPPPPPDVVSLDDTMRLLGITRAGAVALVREGMLAIDERASTGETVMVRRRDVARARWWFRHKEMPYAERQLPPAYVVPPAWERRLDDLRDEKEAREGA